MSKTITITEEHKKEARFANLKIGTKMKSLLKIKWQKSPDGVSYFIDPDKPYQEVYFSERTANMILNKSANERPPRVQYVENIHELTKYGYTVEAQEESSKPSRRRS